jgi:RNA polymerase sigma-70 factor (ECF subfamily)
MPKHSDLAGVIHTHAARVRRVLARRGVATADLPDAEQEVFLVAHRKLAELEVRSSLLGWLLAIAANVASQHRRKASRRRERVGLTAEPVCEALDPLAQLQAAERSARMRRWLAALSAEQRDVIVLHELSELSMHEVARELRVPLKTAFSRLYAAHRALRRAAERESLCERAARPPRRGIGAALASFVLGFKCLSRAQAALLPVPIAALVFVAASVGVAPSPLSLTSASTERASPERLKPLDARAIVPSAVLEPARMRPERAVRLRPVARPVPEAVPARSTSPELIVLHVNDEYAVARLPYPHPFEERAWTTVDPSTVKPRVVTR